MKSNSEAAASECKFRFGRLTVIPNFLCGNVISWFLGDCHAEPLLTEGNRAVPLIFGRGYFYVDEVADG